MCVLDVHPLRLILVGRGSQMHILSHRCVHLFMQHCICFASSEGKGLPEKPVHSCIRGIRIWQAFFFFSRWEYIASKFQGEIGVLGELWTVMWSCKAGIVCRTASSDQPAGWHGYQGFSNIPLSPMALGKAPHRSACANQTTNVPEQREISCRQLDPGSPTTHGKGRTSRHNCVFCCCCVHVWLPMWPQESGQGKRGIFFYHNLICV